MKYYEVNGFVLRRYNLGEADKMLVIFSQEFGKIKAIAKSVRKASAKLAGHLEPFCEVKLRLVKGRNLDIIIGAEVVEIYNKSSASSNDIFTGYLELEILDKMLPEGQPNVPAYNLLKETLKTQFTGSSNARLASQYFGLKFLYTIGSQPSLDNTTLGKKHYLAYDSGEVVSERPNSHYGIMSDDTIKFWRLIYSQSLKQITRVNGIEKILPESESLLMHYYEYHFHLKFKSQKIFQDSAM
jgi:DNA repair protein RecO